VATSVTIDGGLFFDGPTYDASVFRGSDAAALAWNGAAYGGLYQQPNRMKVSASSGMNITIDLGTAVIPSAAGVTDGAYRVHNSQVRTLTCAASDLTNPRIDLAVTGVQDNGDATSTPFIEIITGVPAPSPSVPSTPTNTIALAQVAVGAGVSSIVAGNITDVRVFTATPGGILPVATTSAAPSGVEGQYGHDTANHRLFHISGSGAVQARVLPWAPQVASRTSDSTSASAAQTIATVNITVDGSTDIEVVATWSGIYGNGSNGGFQAVMAVEVDGTPLMTWNVDNRTDDGITRSGGSIVYETSSGVGDTPTAGTHAITWVWSPSHNGSTAVHVAGAGGGAPLKLYVRPVPL
jgi:hypothetical protein